MRGSGLAPVTARATGAARAGRGCTRAPGARPHVHSIPAKNSRRRTPSGWTNAPARGSEPGRAHSRATVGSTIARGHQVKALSFVGGSPTRVRVSSRDSTSRLLQRAALIGCAELASTCRQSGRASLTLRICRNPGKLRAPVRNTPFIFIRMRRVHRLTAAMMAVLVIHLGIATAGMTCPQGDEAAGIAAASVSVEHGSMPAGHTHDGDSMRSHRDDAQPTRSHRHSHGASHCPPPCAPVGCAGTGHCGSASMRVSGAEGVSTFAAGSDVARFQIDTPHSVVTAPEPPPPRA